MLFQVKILIIYKYESFRCKNKNYLDALFIIKNKQCLPNNNDKLLLKFCKCFWSSLKIKQIIIFNNLNLKTNAMI